MSYMTSFIHCKSVDIYNDILITCHLWALLCNTTNSNNTNSFHNVAGQGGNMIGPVTACGILSEIFFSNLK